MNPSNKYKDFYDLFGLPTDATKEDIEKRSKEMIKKFHPDIAEESVAFTPDKFQTLKEARDVLLDNEEKELYDKYGHIDYVEEFSDKNFDGFEFVGRRGIGNKKPKRNSEEISELIQTDHNKLDDITEKGNIIEQPEVKSNSVDDDTFNKHKTEPTEKSIGLTVLLKIGSFLTSTLFKRIIILSVLLTFYFAVYTYVNLLAMIFSIILSIGLFYFPLFRKIF